MKMYPRRFGWLIVAVMGVTLGVVSLRALDNGPWATADALGDVVVSFDDTVRVYDNATGAEKDSDPVHQRSTASPCRARTADSRSTTR